MSYPFLLDELIRWVRSHFPNVPVQSDGKCKPYLLPTTFQKEKKKNSAKTKPVHFRKFGTYSETQNKDNLNH